MISIYNLPAEILIKILLLVVEDAKNDMKDDLEGALCIEREKIEIFFRLSDARTHTCRFHGSGCSSMCGFDPADDHYGDEMNYCEDCGHYFCYEHNDDHNYCNHKIKREDCIKRLSKLALLDAFSVVQEATQIYYARKYGRKMETKIRKLELLHTMWRHVYIRTCVECGSSLGMTTGLETYGINCEYMGECVTCERDICDECMIFVQDSDDEDDDHIHKVSCIDCLRNLKHPKQ